MLDFERATEEELIEAALRDSGPVARRSRDELYERVYPKVARWCLRLCGNREEAADLAQDVLLRVHSRLGSFRAESRFSTWLYTVARSVAINRGIREQRQKATISDAERDSDPADPSPGPEEEAASNRSARELRRLIEAELDPIEAKVLYLHHVSGLTLPAITKLLALSNRSGAKAFEVRALRKLRRRLRPDEDGTPGGWRI